MGYVKGGLTDESAPQPWHQYVSHNPSCHRCWRGIDVDDLENYQITVILTFQADGSHDIFLWTFFRRNVYFHLKFLRAGGHLAEVAFQKAANSFLWHNHTHHTS